MSRFKIPSREDANVDTHSTLDAVGKRLGFSPSLQRLMSISPNAFAGWAALQDAFEANPRCARTREGMAMVVSEVNGCDYCIAAHSYVATTFTKASSDELAVNRKGTFSDQKRAVAIGFTKSLVETCGKLTDEDLDAVRAAA